MEYVEGKPLAGPVPLNEALLLAGQILDALDAAHRKGITHRDLKPANILVGKAGVKILDFGIAKIEHAKSAAPGETETTPLTSEGTVLGTLQYMSPEQIEGEEADARSDIFAFGLVLYELITGKRAFEGKTKTSLVASILKDQPRPLSEQQPLSPPALERVLATCLEKDPDKRWQTARDVKHALELISTVTPAPLAPAPVNRQWLWPAITAVLVVALGVTAWMLWPKPAPPARAARFQVKLPDNVTFDEYVSVSLDGHKMVFNATGEQSGFWIHDLDTLEWRRLSGTENGRAPFWSPDSRFLGFAVETQLKKIEVAGGPPQALCSSPVRVGTGAWSREGGSCLAHMAHQVLCAGSRPRAAYQSKSPPWTVLAVRRPTRSLPSCRTESTSYTFAGERPMFLESMWALSTLSPRSNLGSGSWRTPSASRTTRMETCSLRATAL